MMKVLISVIVLFLCAAVNYAQAPLSQRVANYDMDVSLDVEHKRLDARTQLTWINPSPDTVRELQFHLYYNSFKNSRSTWMIEGKQFMSFVGPEWYEDCDWSWTVIDTIRDEDGNDLSTGFAFIHPDDENIHDQSVLRVPLINPVMPFDTAQFEFSWKARIPKAMIRTGYNKDFYFFAQWFPKLGVYEPAGMRYATQGGWNCHQYHADGEYYADFGLYNVRISVPHDFVVGASGLLVEKTTKGDQAQWWFQAADVIDFTWTASPHFEVHKSQWKDVEISVMMYPDHKRFLPRYFESAGNVLEFMDAHVGDYPYPNLTIIDPPIHGLFVGGMEYPTLITSLSTVFLPASFKSTETLVVHEFIHQYFMQMVATNEQEEAWMDEGITTYYESRIMDEYYGEHTSMSFCCGVNIGNKEFNRHEFFSSGHMKIAPNTTRSWEFRQGGYSAMSYNKVALWMQTLEGLVGTEVMDEIMRTYFELWKFRHPCGRDFRAVVDEVVMQRDSIQWPEGMGWYFSQVLEGTDVCDYAVASITNDPIGIDLGYVTDTGTCIIPPQEKEAGPITYHSRVILHRLGEIRVPVEVEITFADGRTILRKWNGMARSHEYSFKDAGRIVSAEIDPKRKIYLDLNFLNNSKTVSPQREGINYYFIRCLTTVQHFMESLTVLL